MSFASSTCCFYKKSIKRKINVKEIIILSIISVYLLINLVDDTFSKQKEFRR